jgi:glutamate--cysteine ligase
MSRDLSDATPITSRAELVQWIAAGEKPLSAFRLGTEHEKFPFYRSDLAPVPYDGSTIGRPGGIKQLLEGMSSMLGWEPILDGGNIIGLADVTGGGAISLEPGGQFELSGAPLETLHETCAEVHAHLAQVNELAEPMGIGFLGLGMSPKWTLTETPRMPRARHQMMAAYMPKVGTRGLDMMFRTCTVQVNLDFSDEADMVKKLRVSLALQPLATAIFAASPFTQGKPNGWLSARSAVWLDTDRARTGMLDFVFEPGMGYERYADWALDVPTYFVKRGDIYHNAMGQSFTDLMEGKLPALPGARATISDWANHLGTVFPEVRLKRYLEMRGADSGPSTRLVALSAFWTGLFYDSQVLDSAWQLVKNWSAAERQAFRETAPRLGLKVQIDGRSAQELGRDVLALAQEGLRRRARRGLRGGDETVYLRPVEEIIDSGITPAERMLERYHGAWKGQIAPAFDELVYTADSALCESV